MKKVVLLLVFLFTAVGVGMAQQVDKASKKAEKAAKKAEKAAKKAAEEAEEMALFEKAVSPTSTSSE